MMGSILSRMFLLAFGYAYPGYKCFKSVENLKQDEEQILFWCQYRIPIVALTICQRFGDPFMSRLPFYNEAKLALFIYLWLPKTKPYITRHDIEIDSFLLEVQVRATRAGSLYWHRVATILQHAS